VTDAEHQLVFDLPREKLEDSRFDLIGWYLDQLEEGGLYNSLYLASMIELGCIKEENPEEKDPEGSMITSKSNPNFSSGENHNINLSDMVSWGCMGDALQLRMNNVLLDSQPYPGDTEIWVENGYTN